MLRTPGWLHRRALSWPVVIGLKTRIKIKVVFLMMQMGHPQCTCSVMCTWNAIYSGDFVSQRK